MTPSTSDPDMTTAIDEFRTAANELKDLAETVKRYEGAAKRFELLSGALDKASEALLRAQSGFESFVGVTRSAREDLDRTLRRVDDELEALHALGDRLSQLEVSRLATQISDLLTLFRDGQARQSQDAEEARRTTRQLVETLATLAQQSRARDEETLRRLEAQDKLIGVLVKEIAAIRQMGSVADSKLDQLVKRRGLVF